MSARREIVQVLQTARELIAGGWTQNVAAEDASGKEADPRYNKACCFCALGAIDAAAIRLGLENVYDRAVEVFGDTISSDVVDWNDSPHRTQEHVLAAFDAAIDRAAREVAS